MDAPFPYGLALMIWIASSTVSASMMYSAGPNSSVLTVSVGQKRSSQQHPESSRLLTCTRCSPSSPSTRWVPPSCPLAAR